MFQKSHYKVWWRRSTINRIMFGLILSYNINLSVLQDINFLLNDVFYSFVLLIVYKFMKIYKTPQNSCLWENIDSLVANPLRNILALSLVDGHEKSHFTYELKAFEDKYINSEGMLGFESENFLQGRILENRQSYLFWNIQWGQWLRQASIFRRSNTWAPNFKSRLRGGTLQNSKMLTENLFEEENTTEAVDFRRSRGSMMSIERSIKFKT